MPSSASTEPALARVAEAHRRHYHDADFERIDTAYRVAEKAHRGQIRKSGDPYITHPVAVTEILAEYGLDGPTLEAALLHDTVEDTDLTLAQIERDFGAEVALLIDGVTKLDRIQYSSPQEAQAATIRKMVIAMAQDVRILLMKLADRLHNIRTVAALRLEKQQRVARETLDVYVPLAHRLGVQEIKHELEDRCFAILEPGIYAEIESKLADRAPEREVFIEKVISELEAALSDAGIPATVTGRPKHHYSIYRKMVEGQRGFEEIFDLIGIRIITTDLRNCYGALGLVHSKWVPVSGRFKDFIAMPKTNLYQSLHTTVIGPDGKPLEVQLRTEEMHRLAESGIAAHWRYKEGSSAADVPWVGDLPALLETEDPQEFLATLKLDFYQDEVFALTPAGDVKALPRGATAVDFAYAVHTEVGNRCVGVRINGRLLPLSTRLESGDIVEVILSKAVDAGPSIDWLKLVRTSRAKSKIKAFFLRERREHALTEGRELIGTALRKEGLGLGASARDGYLTEIASELGKTDLEALFVAVGDGSVLASTVINRLNRILNPEADEEEDLLAPPRPRRGLGLPGPAIIVEGMEDMLVQIARCCAPVPGDPIVGFVTIGRGVSVHRADCTNIAALADRRMVEVSWPPDRVGSFAVWIEVEALDRTRLLRDVTAGISDLGGNILASSSVTGRDRVAILRYEVELSDPGALPRLLADLKGVDGVFAAYRLVTEPSCSVLISATTLWLAATNSYVIAKERGGLALVVDAPPDDDAIVEHLRANDLTPVALLLTHGHVDHAGGAGPLSRRTKAVVYTHPSDDFLTLHPQRQLQGLFGYVPQGDWEPPVARTDLEDGEVLSLAEIEMEVRHTPGHTPGHCCFLLEAEGILFSGDQLFAGSVGRTDLPGGDWNTLLDSMKRRVLDLDDAVRVLPGHGPETTIGAERRANPFLQGLGS